eukprot:COSAG03_NODE_2285_length_2918_cov_2.984746_2_plen_444_part_00
MHSLPTLGMMRPSPVHAGRSSRRVLSAAATAVIGFTFMQSTTVPVAAGATQGQCYSLPSAQARQGGALVAWNGSLLLVCGSFLPHCGPQLPVHLDDIWSTTAGAATPWRRFAKLGRQNARTHHAAAVLGDTLYILGGYGGPNHSAPVPLDSVVSLVLAGPDAPPRQHRPLPTGPTTNLGVTATDARPGVLFVAGGFVYPRIGAKVAQGETTAAVFAFRPATDTLYGDDAWSPLQPMRTARAAFGFAALPIGTNALRSAEMVRLVAAGGFSRSRTTGEFTPLSSVEAMPLPPHPAANGALSAEWSEMVPLPTARSQLVAVVAEIQASSAGAGLPALVLLGGTNATADDCYRTLSILQRTTLVLETSSVREDPTNETATDSWRTLAVTQRPRGFVAAAVLEGVVVAVGGFNGTQDAPAVDTLDLTGRQPLRWAPCSPAGYKEESG